MKPFFSYYGAKYTTAKYLGAPRHKTVIEPFAGSACYSTRWNVRHARLYDVSPAICALWDWLIRCSEADVRALPDEFRDFGEVSALAEGPQMFVRFWIAKGRAEPSGRLSPWYHQYKNAQDCRVWGPAVKQRVLEQKPGIAQWTIDNLSFEAIQQREAHWHVDPPYAGGPGRRYVFSDVDYAHLAQWCSNLPGHVDVCENMGADWMAFKPLCNIVTSRGRRDGSRSQEVVWRNRIYP